MGHFTEGLLEDDWLTPNKVFLDGMAPLDKIKNLKMFPCFPAKVKSDTKVKRVRHSLATAWVEGYLTECPFKVSPTRSRYSDQKGKRVDGLVGRCFENNKSVWAPHDHVPCVVLTYRPTRRMHYVKLDDEILEKNVEKTMDTVL
ncbi:hypothetical protein DD237_005757 [Peronospora effusa]|uniref:Uncharacterized protein n=1 Tax=Peronospora effusa TaxID=542832 RepID=A0A3R7W2U6_9STRA|nr:hypothetical protein DD237_005757 [Peronospora effusa]